MFWTRYTQHLSVETYPCHYASLLLLIGNYQVLTAVNEETYDIAVQHSLFAYNYIFLSLEFGLFLDYILHYAAALLDFSITYYAVSNEINLIVKLL